MSAEVKRLEAAVKQLEIDREAVSVAHNLLFNLRSVGLPSSKAHIQVAFKSLTFAREAIVRELAEVGSALGKARMQTNKTLEDRNKRKKTQVYDVESELT